MNTLRQDLNKSIVNLGFIASIIITAALCFTAQGYYNDDTGQSYSIIELFLNMSKSQLLQQKSFSNMSLFQLSLGGYAGMFLPIIASLPFITCFCAERNNGNIRLVIIRTGKLKYYLSKFISSCMSGGLSVMLGVVVYGVALRFMFPSVSAYNIDAELMQYYGYNNMPRLILLVLLGCFLYGMVSTLLMFFISSFCKNPYIITCIPFIFSYIIDTFVSSVVVKGYENPTDLYDKVVIFYTSSIRRIYDWDNNTKYVLVLNAGYVLLSFLGFALIMNRRLDKGE